MRSLAKKVLGSILMGVVRASAGSFLLWARELNHQSMNLLFFFSGRFLPKPASEGLRHRKEGFIPPLADTSGS